MKLTPIQKHYVEMTVLYIVVFAFFGMLSYFAWTVGRQINYNWSYKDMVQETICETVKHEHLVNPKVCSK